MLQSLQDFIALNVNKEKQGDREKGSKAIWNSCCRQEVPFRQLRDRRLTRRPSKTSVCCGFGPCASLATELCKCEKHDFLMVSYTFLLPVVQRCSEKCVKETDQPE